MVLFSALTTLAPTTTLANDCVRLTRYDLTSQQQPGTAGPRTARLFEDDKPSGSAITFSVGGGMRLPMEPCFFDGMSHKNWYLFPLCVCVCVRAWRRKYQFEAFKRFRSTRPDRNHIWSLRRTSGGKPGPVMPRDKIPLTLQSNGVCVCLFFYGFLFFLLFFLARSCGQTPSQTGNVLVNLFDLCSPNRSSVPAFGVPSGRGFGTGFIANTRQIRHTCVEERVCVCVCTLVHRKQPVLHNLLCFSAPNFGTSYSLGWWYVRRG